MSDLVSISPLININLYVVAPDDRRTRFVREIARPTFTLREVPLHTVCRFLPYSLLCARIEQAKHLAKFLQPKFLDDIAESYDPAEELDD